ncbi:MAG: GNAT family N-acetyltransferase [Steroidobacteraceae bacterium]|nr:GNAT family N-acetyltransferase [Steroidobacteraceae bacterium]
MPALFETSDLVVRDLHHTEVPLLQALFEANPDYFLLVGGQPPRRDEAQREFDELPPAPLAFGRKWTAGIFDRQEDLHGLLILVSDLCAVGVWHTALFFLAKPLHGTGAAARLHLALENWAKGAGARWLRLGVVSGNAAAERFWSKCGYLEVRTREITNASGQTKTTRVLVKPLAGGTISEYLQLMPRDAAGSTLP